MYYFSKRICQPKKGKVTIVSWTPTATRYSATVRVWALRCWVRDWGWWEYLPEKPEATGGRGIGRRRW